MSVDVKIEQKGIFKKRLPLETITGGVLSFGTYDDSMRLDPGKAGENGFTAYLEDGIARGFGVSWNKDEKNSVSLRLLSPTSEKEMRAFFDCVLRIASYWKCIITVDGAPSDAASLSSNVENMVDFNARSLHQLCADIIDGKVSDITLYSAFWPLTLGKSEAESFIDDPDAFFAWLHEKQSVDAYYAAPAFFRSGNEIIGRYVLTEDTVSIFPQKPSVMFGVSDSETKKAIKCDRFAVGLYSISKKALLHILDYDAFIAALPQKKLRYYDANHFIIDALSLSELDALR